MKLTKVLQEIGLSENEARIYIALLELGEASVSELSKKAKIKRPTAYLILEALENKGLARTNHLHQKAVYMAANPKELAKELEATKNLVKVALPKLMQTYNASKR